MPQFGSTLLRLAAAAALAGPALANGDVNTAFTPDGKLIIAGYLPSVPLSVVGLVVFGLSTLVLWSHFFRSMHARYMLVLTIGMLCMTLGFVFRILYHGNPATLGMYILQTMFILLSPCAFLAMDYMLLGRLARALGDDAIKCLFIRPTLISKVFVTSDIITFLLQAAGGGMSAGNSDSMRKVGPKLALVGLILQLISFGIFTLLLLVWGVRVQKRLPRPIPRFRFSAFSVFSKESVEDWRPLFWVMCLTCVGIIVRSTFRTVEYSQGYYGYLATHEGYFYLLDALPLWLAMSLYCYFYPARFIDGAKSHSLAAVSSSSSEGAHGYAQTPYDHVEKGSPGTYRMQQFRS
ncbi:RTA-like protein [Rhodotorula toruloides]|uniref:RTA-like protein n=1 Tax=Rhodotorula toruloides TaxID=5286 RepID=A0A511K951_RHOTO|nr:RTA-like protein [Rhodotorula toruloides]